MPQAEENVVMFPADRGVERGAVADRLVGEVAAGTLSERARKHRDLHMLSTQRLLEENEALVGLVERGGAEVAARDSRIAALVAQNADLRMSKASLERRLEESEASAQECALAARAAEERASALEHNIAVAFRQIDEQRISAENFLSGAASLVGGPR